MEKAKLIHLKDETFKTLSKHSIDRGTSLKKLIEDMCDTYARKVTENGSTNAVRFPEP